MASRQLPLPIGPIRNSHLFSNHWLEHRLPLEPEWDELREEASRVLDTLGHLWERECSRVEHYSEGGLEEAFIQRVFAELGWTLYYQTFLRGRKPDYALFLDENSKDAAIKAGKNNHGFWDHAALVADAKAWSVNLDRPTKIDGKREYPPEQMEWYIRYSWREWGILTNGRLWRLYPSSLSAHQPRFETYLECDLEYLLEGWAKPSGSTAQHVRLIDDFLRFYLFFSATAFRSTADRKPLAQRAIEGSNAYRLGVGEGLKERVFEALEIGIEGFLNHVPNNLDPGRHLELCREQSLILLYRLLFIMYGEDRGLLPYHTNRTYRDNRSLSRLRDLVAGQLDQPDSGTGQDFGRTSCELWGDLSSLFDLIDGGRKSYGVPPYNGGLFDREENAFLAEKTLPDSYLARVVDRLGRAPDPEHPDAGLFSVDYRDLSIQHLGHVYEGLLELRPHYATEPMIIVRRTGRRTEEKALKVSERIPSGFRETGKRYDTGQVFLLTDKGERRASGSYYTPNHIVDHIVKRTLGPLCQEITKKLEGEIGETEEQFKRRRGCNREILRGRLEELRSDFDDRILQLNVLDPAMGSGHFLLRACQYLAEEIATNPNAGDPGADQLKGDESVLTYWKRKVVEHCVYGVDINPLAVELAKVALWLETASRDEPLTFLDHHLRSGNSLVGGRVADLGTLPGTDPLPLFEQHVSARLPVLLEAVEQISRIPSDKLKQVQEKEKLLRKVLDPAREPFLGTADLWCATFYQDAPERLTPEQYREALDTLDSRTRHRRLARQQWYSSAAGLARSPDVMCFHWELEFPEVFFGQSGRKDGAGFDAVIGNPPYDVLSEKEIGRDLRAFKGFLRAQALYAPSFRGKNNLYKLFVCLALDLLCEGGRMGFITPMAVLGDDQAASLRKEMLRVGAFTSIDAFPQKDNPTRRVFPEAKLSTAVFSLIKTHDDRAKAEAFVSRVHPAREIESASPSLKLSTAKIPLYDPVNLTIVSCSQKDWDLAVKIAGSGRMVRLRDFAEFFQGEVNETIQRSKGTLITENEGGKLVTRGACICLYVPREASQGTDLYLDVQAFLDGKGENTKAYHHKNRRVGLQESSPQNNFRRIIACMIPNGEFCNHKVNYLAEHTCGPPLELPLGLLNSKLADWYFRLGSTNAAVSHYQLYNLPCPAFLDKETDADKKMRDAALGAIREGDMDKSFDVLKPALSEPPFSLSVRDTIVSLVRRIIQAEEARGQISRTQRSRLCAAAQPYQNLIDRLLYAMAGLTDQEARGLEERLRQML